MSRFVPNLMGCSLSVLLLLYVVQAIPMAFFSTLLPILLRQEAYSLTQIALLQLIKLPWLIKFIWAPWVDSRTRSLPTLRRTIIVSELVYALFIILLCGLDLHSDLVLILSLVLLSFVASSVQDIALDKYAILTLRRGDRSLGNAMQSGGNFLGNIIGAGIGVSLFYYLGWNRSVLLLGGVLLCVLLPFYLLQQRRANFQFDVENMLEQDSPEEHKPNTEPRYCISGISHSLRGFYEALPSRRYLYLLLLFYTPLMPLMVLVKPMLIDWHYSPQTVAMILGIWGAAIAALSSFFSGWLLKRVALRSVLPWIYGLSTAVSLYFIWIAQSPSGSLEVFVAIAGLWALYALASVGLYTLSMNRVRRGFEGTDFTLQTMIAQLGGIIASTLIGKLGDMLGYTAAFGVLVALSFCCFWLQPRLLRD